MELKFEGPASELPQRTHCQLLLLGGSGDSVSTAPLKQIEYGVYEDLIVILLNSIFYLRKGGYTSQRV